MVCLTLYNWETVFGQFGAISRPRRRLSVLSLMTHDPIRRPAQKVTAPPRWPRRLVQALGNGPNRRRRVYFVVGDGRFFNVT